MQNNSSRQRSVLALVFLAVSLAGCGKSGDNPVPDNIPTDPSPVVPVATAVNNAPSISGAPDNMLKIGDGYSFQPAATDPEGDTLVFSIQNMPRWASFDSANGELTGQAKSGDVGSYENIVVSVSDGELSSELPAFSVQVVQNGIGSVTLSWIPPTANTDGSPLTDLAAYKFYYGLAEGDYPNQITIDNPGIATYVVDDLTPNTYFFVATAINTQGIESDFSNVAIKVVL